MPLTTLQVCIRGSSCNSSKTLLGVHEIHDDGMNPITVLQLFCWPMTHFIIGLPYDHPHPPGSRQLAYKNFGC